MLSAQLFRLVLVVTGRLPLSVMQLLGALTGELLWLLNTRMAKVTLENISLSFPQLPADQQKAMAKKSLRETGKNMFETAKAWTAPREHCEGQIKQVYGDEKVDRIIASGKGIIFIIPHLGSWEMITHVIGTKYRPVHMYRANRSKGIDKLVLGYRQRTGAPLVAAGRHGIKAQLDALKRGGTISTMPDQEPEVHTGEFAPFFGIESLTSTLIPGFVKKTRAIPVIAWCQRLDNAQGFEVHLEPIDLAGGLEMTTTSLNSAVESAVRQIPEQYLWSYKRFKTRPAGDTEYYQFRQSGPRFYFDKAVVSFVLLLGKSLSLTALQAIGSGLADFARLISFAQARDALTNLTLCTEKLAPRDVETLFIQAFRDSGKTLMETGKIWRSSDEEFDALIEATYGLEHFSADRPLIVLTPPLGNREVLIRYLASQFKLTEYYYPHSHFPRRHTAADDATERQRNSWQVELIKPQEGDIDALIEALHKHRVVALCPDQQPRLRNGEFIPFLGINALTNRELARLFVKSNAVIVFGAAIRALEGFEIFFHPFEMTPTATETGILESINSQLETIVLSHPAQYRWSDKRFNIRPSGEPKVYRRTS